jgi:oligopeptide/dipeptide ABC transporter ATP-binding protein
VTEETLLRDETIIEELVPAAQRRPRRERGESPLLVVDGLRTSFHTRDGVVRAVDGISFSVDRGEIVGLVGESGCGKSVTSLSILRLIARPGIIEGGRIVFDGRDLLTISGDEMRKLRGDAISMIFQQPTSSLNPVWDVGTQISEVLELHRNMKGKAAKARAIELLRMVGIPDPERRLKAYPHELSGGMAQRVMIAMALACEPDLLIADEPTTALDVTIQAQILDLMRKLREETGTAIILITHDLGVVAEMCDRVAVMYAGEIVEQTDVATLFREPLHPYTRGLIGSIPVMGDLRAELAVIPGNVPNLIDLPAACRFAPRCAARVEHEVTLATELHPELLPVGDGHDVRCWLYHDATGGQRPRPTLTPIREAAPSEVTAALEADLVAEEAAALAAALAAEDVPVESEAGDGEGEVGDGEGEVGDGEAGADEAEPESAGRPT